MRVDRRVARTRARQGVARVRSSAGPILVASVAAAVAYAIAHFGLGHAYPFFAPVAAWLCLGFDVDRDPRRVLELAIGVGVGVALGDLVVSVIGSGAWQVGLVLATSALVARLVGQAPLLTTQAGVQAIAIVVLPAGSSGGPLGRWTDALVGGAVALVVAVLSPRDPRRRLGMLGREAVDELAGTVNELGHGMRERSEPELRAALVRGRASAPALADWAAAAATARELARVNARARRHVEAIATATQQAVLTDRAMRTVRVLARRAATSDAPQRDTVRFGEVLGELSLAVRDLSSAVGEARDPERARASLLAVARELDPHAVAPDDWQVQAQVLLARSVVVDTYEAAGGDPDVARAALPVL